MKKKVFYNLSSDLFFILLYSCVMLYSYLIFVDGEAIIGITFKED